MDQPETIHFYSVAAPFGEFSNFARYPIRLKGKTWPTSEHYFQAQKFAGKPQELVILKAPTPMKAAELGRSRRERIDPSWDKKKDQVMMDALRAKFTQHADMKELLLSTGNAILVEHTENDEYWGDGGDGSGKNRLGKLLMQLREELRRG